MGTSLGKGKAFIINKKSPCHYSVDGGPRESPVTVSFGGRFERSWPRNIDWGYSKFCVAMWRQFYEIQFHRTKA